MDVFEFDVKCSKIFAAQQICSELAWTWCYSDKVIHIKDIDYCSAQVFLIFANGETDDIFPFDLNKWKQLLQNSRIDSIDELSLVCEIILRSLSPTCWYEPISSHKILKDCSMSLAKLAYRTAFFKCFYREAFEAAFDNSQAGKIIVDHTVQ